MDRSRENLRAYRCFGGFMLFTGIFANILSVVSTPAIVLFSNIVSNTVIGNELFILVSSAIIVYTYYLGYRIFIKSNKIGLYSFKPVESRKIISCILTCLAAFGTIRLIWYAHFMFLDSLPIAYGGDNESAGVVMIVYGALVAPVVEEVVFRGWMLKLLKKYGNMTAVILTALGFGLMHGTLQQTGPAIMIGIIFGIIALEYDSVLPTVFLHMATNSLSVLAPGIDESRFITLYIILAIMWIILTLWISRRKLKEAFSGIGNLAPLMICSLSFITFVILSLLMIRTSFSILAAILPL